MKSSVQLLPGFYSIPVPCAIKCTDWSVKINLEQPGEINSRPSIIWITFGSWKPLWTGLCVRVKKERNWEINFSKEVWIVG